MSTHLFHIRGAGRSPTDAEFIVAAFDSSIRHLAATGNAGQWGVQPFSEREGFAQEARDDVAKSVKFREDGTGERIRIFIAEVEEPQTIVVEAGGDDELHRWTDNSIGKTYLSVGALTLRDDEFAQHILTQEAIKQHVADAKSNPNGFVYIDVIITDYRTSEQLRKGAGASLVERAKQYAREWGKSSIYIDCWTGGTGKLVPYYEALGFKSVQDFQILRKSGDVWPGRLLKLDISTEKC